MTSSDSASLIATLLGDRRLWRRGEQSQARPDTQDHLVDTALELYTATSGAFMAADADHDDHLSQAIWIIRDIGDRCAIFSQGWSSKELHEWINVPDRASVEDSLRSSGVEKWAADLGVPLALGPEEPQAVAGPSRLWKLRTSRRRVAEEFIAVDSKYRMMLDIRRSRGTDWFSEHPLARKTSAGFIAGSRNDFLWGAITEDDGALVVAEAMILMAQGMFVATHTPEASSDGFPTTSFLYDFLHRKGGYRWLSKHGRHIPEWLQPQGPS